MKTWIVYPNGEERCLNVRRLDVEVFSSQPLKTYNAAAFFKDFWQIATDCGVPYRQPKSEDYGIATRLLKQYSRERMIEMSDYFWHTFASPVVEHDDANVMRLFAARIPDIERETT